MRSLLLAAHNDDEALFAAFLCQQHRPLVITVLRSVNQDALGITASERQFETAEATTILGCAWQQWDYPDDDPDWGLIGDALANVTALGRDSVGPIFAPWPEPRGHPQHNRLGEIALEVYGPDRVTFYTTYRYGGPRSTGDPVEPTREQVLGKLRALACYESQILRGPVRFFTHPLDEYTRRP